MGPTDTRDPQYYHRVVDCQWACPAHTNVPEYIRLIAAGRYTDSYMLNRESNVFPGILGRTCDRPCEPACRRTRVEDEPVAICRLKRVAADLRDDVQDLLPRAPELKNGKRVALIGAGPASLTVANDLMPLGYEVVIFEGLSKPGGLMRTNIPSFRLPVDVLEEEMTLAGPIVADLWVSTSGTASDWIVKVIDVFPPDTPDYGDIPKRMRMGNYHMMVRSEVIRGRFRNSAEHPEPFVPDEPTNVRFELQDVLHTFGRGHRIMMQIQSTWFPMVDRNPQKYVDNIFEADESDFIKATQRVYRNGERGTRLIVNVLRADQ